MTVESLTVQTGPYFPNGVTTVFPFDFAASGEDEILVQINGVTVGGGYSVSLADDRTGSVTFVNAPASGSLMIYSDPAFDQQVVLANQGRALPSTLDEVNDRGVIRDLWLRSEIAEVDAAIDPLAALVATLLAGTAPLAFPISVSVAAIGALRLVPYALLSSGVGVDVQGYYAAGDGGGGMFIWNATSTVVDDGGMTINPTGNPGAGRWIRNVNSFAYDVRWWGAKREASFDNGPAFRAAVKALEANQYAGGPGPSGGTTGGYGLHQNGCALYIPFGKWEVRSDDPGSTLNPCGVRIRKPVDIFGDGFEATVIEYYTATFGIAMFRVKPATAAEGGASYLWGGSIKDLRIDPSNGSENGSGILIDPENPSAVLAHVVERVHVVECYRGISMVGVSGTTVYGSAVRDCTVKSVIAGGAGFHASGGSYNVWHNIESYVVPGQLGFAYYMEELASSYTMLRAEGAAFFDCPFSTGDITIEYVNDTCSHNGNAALRFVRFGAWEAITLLGVGGIGRASTGVFALGANWAINYLRMESLSGGGLPDYPVLLTPDCIDCVISNVSTSAAPTFKLETFWTAASFETVRLYNCSDITDLSRDAVLCSVLPTANAMSRGLTRHLKGGTGVADRFVVCRKDAADAYAWADLF